MNARISMLLLALAFDFHAEAKKDLPSDKNATRQTINLFNNLKKLPEKGYLVGHQDALAYGVNWKYEDGRSDVKEVVGDYPALYGWELGDLELGASINLDSVPFDKMKNYIRRAYQKGSVVTISWHGNNPLTGKTAWDPASGTVASILPGGAKHQVFVQQLDRVAQFLADLKGSKGEAIPILLRPFHELTGDWFWWGPKGSTAEEFKTLFRFTIGYLRNTRNLHNLLIVYNTAGDFKNSQEFLERYPGDDCVDILSFDTYQHGDPEKDSTFAKNLKFHLSIVEEAAAARNKIPAIGELGFNQIPYSKWFTKTLYESLEGHKFAYLLFWRNAGVIHKNKTTEFFAPYIGHSSASDFVQFYNAPETLFERDLKKLKVYK